MNCKLGGIGLEWMGILRETLRQKFEPSIPSQSKPSEQLIKGTTTCTRLRSAGEGRASELLEAPTALPFFNKALFSSFSFSRVWTSKW